MAPKCFGFFSRTSRSDALAGSACPARICITALRVSSQGLPGSLRRPSSSVLMAVLTCPESNSRCALSANASTFWQHHLNF